MEFRTVLHLMYLVLMIGLLMAGIGDRFFGVFNSESKRSGALQLGAVIGTTGLLILGAVLWGPGE
jgi:hypothetical protein